MCGNSVFRYTWNMNFIGSLNRVAFFIPYTSNAKYGGRIS